MLIERRVERVWQLHLFNVLAVMSTRPDIVTHIILIVIVLFVVEVKIGVGEDGYAARWIWDGASFMSRTHRAESSHAWQESSHRLPRRFSYCTFRPTLPPPRVHRKSSCWRKRMTMR